jgi:ABC-type Fe3+ transport system permease subunit
MNPYEPPQIQPMRPAKLLPVFVVYVAFLVCTALVLVGIGISGFGLLKILETTPGMGIPVDAQGNRLPVEGYPQLWLGLAITGIFSVLALIPGSTIVQMRADAFFSRLDASAVPLSTNNPMARSEGSSAS